MKKPSVVKDQVGFILGIIGFLFFLLAPLPLEAPVKKTFAVLLLCAVWWATETIPLAATALLPGFLLPLMGILPLQAALNQYANRLIFLFLGGFIIAQALVKWEIDRRIALNILSKAGTDPRRLLLYFMIATGGISAFISNTATAAMMYPIGMSILLNVRMKEKQSYGKILMLGIAYAASIGGVATLVGTPPNVVLSGFASSLLGAKITFLDWLKIGLPYSVIMLPVTWFILILNHKPDVLEFEKGQGLAEQLKKLGALNRGQKITIAVFILAALLWITQSFWDRLPFPAAATIQSRVDDSVIAMLCALLLFIVPIDFRNWKAALEWKDTRDLSWDIIILFGGGLCLGEGLFKSGAAGWIANAIPFSNRMHPFVLILIVATLVSFISEFASNTAVATMMIPILVVVAQSLHLPPYLFIIPAAVAVSNVFMLPIATPPNAIVCGSGYIPLGDMAKIGLVIHLVGIVIIALVNYFVSGKLFGMF